MFPVSVLVVLELVIASAGPVSGSAEVVSFDGPSTPELDLTLADLTHTLAEMTGRPWRRAQHSKTGVRLVLRPDPEFRGRSPETFRLRATGPAVELSAADPRGLVMASYELLERLGVRWPLPGEQYTVIPRRPELRLNLNVVLEPRFRMREFFGTGGTGSRTPLDPEGRFDQAWRDYARRNRWGGPDHIRGHVGSAFAAAHRVELETHSDWRAELKGVRAPWSPNLKLCASSTGAVAAFVSDRLDALGKLIQQDQDAFAISVEPADGGGHCECARCRALGGVSERVFTLANAVARGAQQRYPGRWVSLYAYNEHAAVPSITLEPNLFVMVCPYGFQRTGLDPDEFIAAWRKKVQRLGVYDYWAIPDWSRDVPTLELEPMIARLDGWASQNIEAFMLESSFAGASMGPALWIAARHFFPGKRALSAEQGEWAKLVYGPGAPALEPLLQEWAQGYIPSTASLGRAYAAAERALPLTADDPRARDHLLALVRYVEYLRLRFELDATPKDAPERRARTKELLRWVLAIAPDLSVSSYRLYQMLVRNEDPARELESELKIKAAPIDASETLERLRRGRASYPARGLFRAAFAGAWVPAQRASTPRSRRGERVAMSAAVTELSVQARTSTSIVVELGPNASAPTRVLLLDERGKRLEEHKLVGPGAQAAIRLRADQRCVLKIVDPKNVFRVRWGGAVRVTLTRFISPSTSPALYFFVPEGTSRLVLDVPSVVPARLSDADGNTVLDEVRGLIDVEVPAAQRGRVWSISGYRGWQPLRAVSVPQAFALDPEDLLVPEQALRAR